MGKKNKLIKFEDLHTFPNVYENIDPKNPGLWLNKDTKAEIKGQWNKLHFKNVYPLILELACGRGEYTVALAQAYPDHNFIGVDIKGARIWQGAAFAMEQNLLNAAFLRTRIEQIELFFEQSEVDEIWITFPDPFLRESKENKRLTSARFLNRYKNIIKADGILHLKTDDPTLYQFTLDTLHEYPGAKLLYANDDIYASELKYPELLHKTHYEKEHLEAGKKIKYIRFTI
ncbi:MAG: tRNA (guanosine(46)-N7)-methyltransferase TrmB [Saprospiraceae bacterium]|nr:tRNA (guanosine(46)-N7)-methyltransferase TrmB [Saprospiraceae bacterium]